MARLSLTGLLRLWLSPRLEQAEEARRPPLPSTLFPVCKSAPVLVQSGQVILPSRCWRCGSLGQCCQEAGQAGPRLERLWGRLRGQLLGVLHSIHNVEDRLRGALLLTGWKEGPVVT